MNAYRTGPPPQEAYSLRIRFWPCDQCGEALEALHRGGVRSCPACGTSTDVPDPIDLRVPRSGLTEEQQRARLAPHDEAAFFLHEDTTQYTAILPHELPEVRRQWGEARRHYVARRDDPDRVHRFFSLSFAIVNNLPSDEEHRLAKRALCQATAETVDDPAMRQRMLTKLSNGAARAGDLESAHAWIERCDPRSPDIHADSAFRVSQALIAVAEDRPADVLRWLGRRIGEWPADTLSRTFAGCLRAHALECLGEASEARAALHDVVRRGKAALSTVEAICGRTPSWRLCAETLPEVRGDVLAARSSHLIGSGGELASFVVVFAVVMLGLAILRGWLLAIVSMALLLVASLLAVLLPRRRAASVARGAVRVEGRVHDVEHLGRGNAAQYEVTLQRMDGSYPPIDVTIRDTIPNGTSPAELKGLSFEGYWNPELPNRFVSVIISTPK